MDNVTIAKPPTREDASIGLRMIHSYLAASRLVWSRTLPKRPGYYWLRDSLNVEPIVVLVRTDYSEVSQPLVVQEHRSATSGVQYLRDYEGDEWAGPIEEPDEQ